MQKGKFNIVTDGGWGSCGKGAIASYLTYAFKPEILSTTNMSNAGHVAVNIDGERHVAKALPSTAIIKKWVDGYNPHVFVGSSAAFDLDQMFQEIKACDVANSLSIHPRAGVITQQHKLAESQGDCSTKHIASTMQGCSTFLVDKILRKPDLKLARDYPELAAYSPDNLYNKLNLSEEDKKQLMGLSIPEILHMLMVRYQYTILHEGSQGFSLDINHGSHYPHCTSRGTTAIQNTADMGISARDLGDIFLVIRPYPIRVGNITENGKTVGYSGDCYPDQKEISWEEMAKDSGMPQEEADKLTKTELTTVTKRLRRVFTFSDRQLREAVIVNGATKIALNFANYIDYNVYGINVYEKLTQKVKDFICRIEDISQIPVTIVGTGPRIDHMVMV